MAQESTITQYSDPDPLDWLTIKEGKLIRGQGKGEVLLDLGNVEDRQWAVRFVTSQRQRLQEQLEEIQKTLQTCDEIEKFVNKQYFNGI